MDDPGSRSLQATWTDPPRDLLLRPRTFL